MSKEDTIFFELALKSNALLLGDFTLKSGKKSPYFFNAARMLNGGYLYDEEEEDHFPDFAKYLDDKDMEHMERVFERRKTEEKAEAEVTPEKKEDAKE